VPFFLAFHLQDSLFAPERVLVLDLPDPAGVPRISPTSRTVSSLQAPFGAAVRAHAGVAASATPAATAVAAAMRSPPLLMRRGP